MASTSRPRFRIAGIQQPPGKMNTPAAEFLQVESGAAAMRRLLGMAGAALMVVGAGAPDGSPDEVLKEKGLRRTGTQYVVPGEETFARKFDAARVLYKALALAIAQQKTFDQGSQSSKELVRELLQESILLNEQLQQSTNVEQHNQIVVMVNQVNARISLLRDGGGADPKLGEQLRSQAATNREKYLQALLDLRARANAITARYETLAKDEEVTQALQELGQKSKTKPTLGPSRTFLANLKLLEKVESAIQTESVELRKEGGVFWVEVTLNDKITIPMVFDTGASICTLRADLAQRAGLKPSSSDPSIQLRAADGAVTEGRLVKLASVRVGKFTIENVDCAVMPADKKDAPALLGGTFLRNFTYNMNAETGSLKLSRVDTAADNPRPTGRPATPKRSVRPAPPARAKMPKDGAPAKAQEPKPAEPDGKSG
jgi:clan AA aspartic protease (TIGR02281 family)